MKVVSYRVDALTLAYRVELLPGFVARLKERAEVAKSHGRASMVWKKMVFGELRYSRAERVWNLTHRRWRMRVDMCAPGAVDVENIFGEVSREPGWTIEIVWDSQALADNDLKSLIFKSRAMVEQLGRVFEVRDRRIDLCADVAGWTIEEADRVRIVRRSRCGVVSYDNARDEKEEPARVTLFEKRALTGITVGKDALMLRIYDKRVQLEAQPEPKRAAEQARWTSGGWDGEEPVTRVEFQLRGTVLRDFGVRDPEAPVDPATGEVFDGLHVCIDRLWQACLSWVRIVVPRESRSGVPVAISRCALDPRWEVLRAVRFRGDGKPGVAQRRRLRGVCSSAQALGASLSVLAGRGELPCFTEEQEHVESWSSFEAAKALQAVLGVLCLKVSFEIGADLIERQGSPEAAMAHLVVSVRASVARHSTGEEVGDGDETGNVRGTVATVGGHGSARADHGQGVWIYRERAGTNVEGIRGLLGGAFPDRGSSDAKGWCEHLARCGAAISLRDAGAAMGGSGTTDAAAE